MLKKGNTPEYIFCYPPPAIIPRIKAEEAKKLFSKQKVSEPINLYVHLPFCVNKCNYCGFVSFTGISQTMVDQYLDLIEKELGLYKQFFDNRILVETVHLGGGTPTYLNKKQLKRLKNILQENVTLESVTEFSSESSPETLDEVTLELLAKIGVNRLCIGVQTFDDNLLKECNRAHNSKKAIEVIKLAKDYINAIDLDLIVGLPHQKISNLEETLKIASELQPSGISIDRYFVQENSKFGGLFFTNNKIFPQKEEVDEMLGLVQDSLSRKGYKRTSVSMHNLEGEWSDKHFKNKWGNKPIIGLGVGSHGFFDDMVYFNIADLKTYEELLRSNYVPITRAEKLSEEEVAHRYAVLTIKLLSIYFRDFRRLFRQDFEEMFKDELGYLEESGLIKRSSDRVELTEKGILNWVDVSGSFYSSDVKSRLIKSKTNLKYGSRLLQIL